MQLCYLYNMYPVNTLGYPDMVINVSRGHQNFTMNYCGHPHVRKLLVLLGIMMNYCGHSHVRKLLVLLGIMMTTTIISTNIQSVSRKYKTLFQLSRKAINI